MAVFKCKMCGGDLEVAEGISVIECEYCETKQTIPSIDNEKKLNFFNRANRLRMNSEFDKAASIYESIVAEFPEEAEAYWGLCLCNYGIEYVDDPATGKKIPTCHRASFDSIQNDENFSLAIEYADVVAQKVYRDEAREIDRIMQDILAVSRSEKPYDVFICYKETDSIGGRTPDSVAAQDVYDALTAKGLNVFFSRITLEDKLGRQYEPYIFAALNSAKVMLVIGTKYEYFHAVWVKNEWSRFLKLMAKDKAKVLIPCFKDIDAYDMPEEFKNLQSQDLGKLGAIQDLVRGVEKIIGKKEEKVVAPVTVTAQGNLVEPLIERAFMFLEDDKLKSADEYFEKALDLDPKNAQAYLGKLLVEQKVIHSSHLKNVKLPFDNSEYYSKIMRFGDDALKQELSGYVEYIKTRNEKQRVEGIYIEACKLLYADSTENEFRHAAVMFRTIINYNDSAELENLCYEKAELARKENIYFNACNRMSQAKTEKEFKEVASVFEKIRDYKDSAERAEKCITEAEISKQNAETAKINAEQAEIARKDAILTDGKAKMIGGKIENYNSAIEVFKTIPGWKDADEQVRICCYKIEEINEKLEAERQRQAEIARKLAKKRKRTKIIIALFVIFMIVSGLVFLRVLNTKIIPEREYQEALALMEAGNYIEAAEIFDSLYSYSDSEEKVKECWVGLIDTKHRISIGEYDEVGIRANGYSFGSVAVGGRLIAVDHSGTGIKADGTVVSAVFDVSGWTDIIEITSDHNHLIGLKSDGTVVAAQKYGEDEACEVSDWTDIITVATGYHHTAGVKSDGTVVAVGNNDYGQCDTSEWTDIVELSANYYSTVGLKSDGTVVATSNATYDVSEFTDLVSIASASWHFVGLKSDGTVVATGSNDYGQCDVEDWKDIVAVFAGGNRTVGLKADGTVVATGENVDEILTWNLNE